MARALKQCDGTKDVECPDCGLVEPCFSTHLIGRHRSVARCYVCAVKKRDAEGAARANVVPTYARRTRSNE